MNHKPLQRGQVWRVHTRFKVATDNAYFDFNSNHFPQINLKPGDKFLIDEIWVRGNNRHTHKYSIVLMNNERGMLSHSHDIYKYCELVSD